jgi:hypothetical protein
MKQEYQEFRGNIHGDETPQPPETPTLGTAGDATSSLLKTEKIETESILVEDKLSESVHSSQEKEQASVLDLNVQGLNGELNTIQISTNLKIQTIDSQNAEEILYNFLDREENPIAIERYGNGKQYEGIESKVKLWGQRGDEHSSLKCFVFNDPKHESHSGFVNLGNSTIFREGHKCFELGGPFVKDSVLAGGVETITKLVTAALKEVLIPYIDQICELNLSENHPTVFVTFNTNHPFDQSLKDAGFIKISSKEATDLFGEEMFKGSPPRFLSNKTGEIFEKVENNDRGGFNYWPKDAYIYESLESESMIEPLGEGALSQTTFES